MTDLFFIFHFTEVQQRLVDRPSGEGRLRHWLHPEPPEAGKHPTPAGAEERTLPWVSREGGGLGGERRHMDQGGDKESLMEGFSSHQSLAVRSWQIGRKSGGWKPSGAVCGPGSPRCAWVAATTEFSIRWGDEFHPPRWLEMLSTIISPHLQHWKKDLSPREIFLKLLDFYCKIQYQL